MRQYVTSVVVFLEFFWKALLALFTFGLSVFLMLVVQDALAYFFAIYIFLVSLFAAGTWLAEAIEDYRSYRMTERMHISFQKWMDEQKSIG